MEADPSGSVQTVSARMTGTIVSLALQNSSSGTIVYGVMFVTFVSVVFCSVIMYTSVLMSSDQCPGRSVTAFLTKTRFLVFHFFDWWKTIILYPCLDEVLKVHRTALCY